MITLATLSQATEQEVFDQVAVHLMTQGEKSSTGATCRYRWNGLTGHGSILCVGITMTTFVDMTLATLETGSRMEAFGSLR